MKQKTAPPQTRKSVLLALGFYVHEINVGVAKYARSANWILDDITSRNGMIPPGWKGDGIIALLPSFSVPTWDKTALIEFVRNARTPVVDLCDQLPELPFPRVLPDNEAIGILGAQHLIDRGFKHFAFYTHDREAPVVKGRMESFRNTVLKAGREFHLVDYSGNISGNGARQCLIPWLGRQFLKLPKPVAAMAQYDGDANDIARACQQAGLRIPEDVAIVGADNDPIYAELGPVPLSSVVTNREQIGYAGAKLLDRLMRGETPPKYPIRIKPGGVVVRKSSDIVAVSDIHLGKAMNFIAENKARAITVDDVVITSGISRRNLYSKFSTHIGHSIQREINRQRLGLAMHLIRTSGEKLQAIAAQCGFEDSSSLSKIFRYHMGISVSEFRRQNRPPA
ncbi:MAG: substrate-binding domain-containing protein [Chthoniobacteraceae bacterium]